VRKTWDARRNKSAVCCSCCRRIDLNTFSHLSVEQTTKLLALLDNYSENFSENPRFVTVDQHEFDNSADCKPPRLKVNYMLEDLKPLIEARLQALLKLSSVHPQRIRGGPQRRMCWGGGSTEWEQGKMCVRPKWLYKNSETGFLNNPPR